MGNVMKYRLGENIEMVIDQSGGRLVQCTQCRAGLGDSPTNWQEKAKNWDLPESWAGPLMSDLGGRHHLEQLFCPSCGALFETRIKEAQT
jgi:hypothetical protein